MDSRVLLRDCALIYCMYCKEKTPSIDFRIEVVNSCIRNIGNCFNCHRRKNVFGGRVPGVVVYSKPNKKIKSIDDDSIELFCKHCNKKTITLERTEYTKNGCLCMRGKCFDCSHYKNNIKKVAGLKKTVPSKLDLIKKRKEREGKGPRVYLPVEGSFKKGKWFGKIVTKPNGASRCFFFCEWAPNIKLYDLRSYFDEVQHSLLCIDWKIWKNRYANRQAVKKHFIRPGFCSIDGRFLPIVKDVFDVEDMLCLSAVRIVDNALEFIFNTENPDVTDFVLKHMKQTGQLQDVVRWCIEAITGGDSLRAATFEISYYSR